MNSQKKRDTRLLIKKTEGEWQLIEKKLKELPGREDVTFNTYMRTEARKMLKKFDQCPNCITPAKGDIKEKRPRVTDETYEKLQIIADRMKINVCDVIEDFIINPLLQGRPLDF